MNLNRQILAKEETQCQIMHVYFWPCAQPLLWTQNKISCYWVMPRLRSVPTLAFCRHGANDMDRPDTRLLVQSLPSWWLSKGKHAAPTSKSWQMLLMQWKPLCYIVYELHKCTTVGWQTLCTIALLYRCPYVPFTRHISIIGGPNSEWVLIPMMGLYTVKYH